MEHNAFKKYTKEKTSNFETLVEQQAGLSFEKQLRFGELIGNEAWQLDMSQGIIAFGELVYPIQIIGSLSFKDSSWMWGWANTQSGLPDNLLQQSHKLRTIGEEEGIENLSKGHYQVEEGFEHRVGLLACGIFETKSYYCANYGQGTLVVTIDSDNIPAINMNKLETVGTTFSQLISSLELNHRNVFLNYLIDREFLLNVSSDAIEGLKEQTIIKAEFDALNRLVALKGRLS